jgi:L,D-peptidoglycan transpeptidase YkuD (ErfK/YbiS/YcfS/YnhG family)
VGRVALRRTAAGLVAALVVTLPAAPSDARPPAVQPDAGRGTAEHGTIERPDRRTVQLGGVSVKLRPGTRQVVAVEHTRGWHARVSLWRASDRHGWQRVGGTRDGRTGYGGLVPGRRREQGTGTTPLGTYPLTESFGLAARPAGTRLPFHRVRAGDYWVQDNRSRFYNQLRHKSRGGFRWWLDGYNSSERLRDYTGQYRWSVVIDFNRPDPVRHRGSGIFLHVNGSGATAGCVSAPRGLVRQVMRWLEPRLRPVVAIDR